MDHLLRESLQALVFWGLGDETVKDFSVVQRGMLGAQESN